MCSFNWCFQRTFWEKRSFSKHRFSKFKQFVSRSGRLQPTFWRLQLTQTSLNFKTFICNLKICKVWEQSCVMLLFHYFNFESINDVLKWKNPCILLNKKKILTKTKRNRKRKIPHKVLEIWTLCFSSYKNRK